MSSIIDYINPLGKPPKYKTAKELWDKFLEYCDWVAANPIEMPERIGISGTKTDIKQRQQNKTSVSRPYTLAAFLAWAGITNWTEFKKIEWRKKGEYFRVIRAIENVIKAQQIDGAMVGLYNSNLTARLNNISEHSEFTGANGTDLMKHPITVVFEGDVKPNLNPNAYEKNN